MDVTKVKRILGKCDSIAELNEVIAAAKKRSSVVAARNLAKRQTEIWERIKTLPAGTKLYCAISGYMLGGELQRGIEMTLDRVVTRSKRVYVKLPSGRYYWFSPVGLERYNVATEPPSNPTPKSLTDSLSKAGEILNSAV